MNSYVTPFVRILVAIFLLATGHQALAAEESESILDDGTHVVILGTGTPGHNSDRAGPSVAVIHNHEAYLFDVGGGSVQRAIEAATKRDIKELIPHEIKGVFLTHLHSDHVLDYVELSRAQWWERSDKLKAWGPKGTEAMTAAMQQMMAADVVLRTTGLQPVQYPESYKVDAKDIEPGLVLRRGDLRVYAFGVPHGKIKHAFGYKIVTPDKTIVLSGDTGFSEEIIAEAKGADLLIHEVISEVAMSEIEEDWQRYHRSYHTTTAEVAEVAKRTRPKLLVLYHIIFLGEDPEDILMEVKDHYDGDVVVAEDLDLF